MAVLNDKGEEHGRHLGLASAPTGNVLGSIILLRQPHVRNVGGPFIVQTVSAGEETVPDCFGQQWVLTSFPEGTPCTAALVVRKG